jgi:hypothetical protein
VTGDTSKTLCPKCRGKLLWNGKLYVCISCPWTQPLPPEDSKTRRKPGK